MTGLEDAVVLEAWQILVVVVMPLAGVAALAWKTWFRPATEHQIEIAEWRKDVTRDIEELQAIRVKLDEVQRCLTDIKVRLARIEERISR